MTKLLIPLNSITKTYPNKLNLFFHCKIHFIKIFILLISLLFAKEAYAAYTLSSLPEDSPDDIFTSVVQSSNAIYQAIKDQDYLVVPLSDAAAGLSLGTAFAATNTGLSLCGPWCGAAGAILGGMAGLTDEALLHFKFTNKRYFSYGIMGAASGCMFKPSLTQAGLMTGVFVSGAFKNHEEYVAPLFMASLAGPLGMPSFKLSAAGSIVDSMLDKTNITSKNPVSSFILVPKFLYDNLGLGMATLGTILINTIIWNEQTLPEILESPGYRNTLRLMPGSEMVQNYTDIGLKAYRNFAKFIPAEQMSDHLEKYVMSLLGGQFFVRWLTVKEITLNQDLVHYFEHLNQAGGGGVIAQGAGALAAAGRNPIVQGGINFAIFFVTTKLVGQGITNSIEKYYNDWLTNTMQINMQKKFFAAENPLRLANQGNFSLYMDNLNRDASVVAGYGSYLFGDSIATSISGAYGVSIVAIHSRNILAYTALYELVSLMILNGLAMQTIAHDNEIKLLNSELVALYEDTKANVGTIAERGGYGVIGKRTAGLSNTLITLEAKQNLWTLALSLYSNVYQTFGHILNYYLVSKEIEAGRLPFDKRYILNKAINDETTMFSWASRNMVSVVEFERSLDRLIVIEGIIDAPSDDLDRIVRITYEGDALRLHNLKVGLKNTLLVKADDLKFTMGKTYAITGDTSVGKTSVLRKIKGIKENGFWGTGEIHYPGVNNANPKIVMISQEDYFPISSTLEEVLRFPDSAEADAFLNEKKRAEMASLLNEMKLAPFVSGQITLDTKKDWYTLSGGEKKKVLISSALIKKPDILILDESFNGLDAKSLKHVQKVIRKHLPNALILVVDHHAQDNNFNFYDGSVHVENKEMTWRDISPSLDIFD
jgi:ABC-type uncharacterized transport system fused permease/ATPase subunit